MFKKNYRRKYQIYFDTYKINVNLVNDYQHAYEFLYNLRSRALLKGKHFCLKSFRIRSTGSVFHFDRHNVRKYLVSNHYLLAKKSCF